MHTATQLMTNGKGLQRDWCLFTMQPQMILNRRAAVLQVDRHTVAALKQLPGGLRALQLEGAACHRCAIWM